MFNTGDVFKAYIYENNRKIAPASAIVTIYKPRTNYKLIDSATMAIATDGQLSYALSASDNFIPAINYKAVITYVRNSKTDYLVLFYDVVRSRLVSVVTDIDIVSELPQLKDNGWKVRGVASSGTASTITDPELQRYEDGYFTGGLAYSVSKDATREVLDFTSSTGTLTTTAFAAPIAAGENYIITRSYTREIKRAFEKLEEKVIRLGRRPELILDPYDLREVHIYCSVAEVCKGLTAEKPGFWWDMWKEYEQKADTAFEGINFKYDFTEDGYIGGEEENSRVNIIGAGRR